VLDHVAIQMAARNWARTLVVTTTGAVTLSATATGYARTVGSFYDDNLWPGMEITPAGFATNTPRVITAVTPLTVTVSGTVPVESAAAGRSLTVGLPSRRAWVNEAFTPPLQGVPYVEEGYLPGPPAGQVTIGPLGEIEAEPTYVLNVSLPAGTGLTIDRYTDALYRLFAPRTAIPLANGDVVRVRSDPAGAPTPSPTQQGETGFAVKVFRAPLRIRTSNIL
jgi:hypothetical protein